MIRANLLAWSLLVAACGDPAPATHETPAPAVAPAAAPKAMAPAPTGPPPGARLGLGRAATAEEIAAWDIDVDASGASLPAGQGTVAEGEALYKGSCIACHGVQLEGGVGPALVATTPKKGFAEDPKLVKAIGNYWPHVTTLFDYVRRAMPQTAPGSLTDDQTYALVAYLLHRNEIVPADFVANAESVRGVKMPTETVFVTDDRLEVNTVR